MALEDLCAKQNSEIVQLNRLVCLFKVVNSQEHLLFYFDDLYDYSPYTIYRSNNTSMKENAIP